MDTSETKEIFFNRAEVEKAEHINCDNCFDPVVFMLKDKEHEFSIGLETILKCLFFAVEKGDPPKLPSSWLKQVHQYYRTTLANEEDICYYDYEYYNKK